MLGPYKKEYADAYIYVPSRKQIVRFGEGSGDNLTDEDLEDGYVDYIYIAQFAPECGYSIEEVDGGEMLLHDLFRDAYKNTLEAAKDVLEFLYDSRELPYIVLEGFGEEE